MSTSLIEDHKLAGLLADVDACRVRLAQQRSQDPTHEVALAMFDADLKRAIHRVTQYQAENPSNRRTYVDARRVA